jgi:hypothetical protein
MTNWRQSGGSATCTLVAYVQVLERLNGWWQWWRLVHTNVWWVVHANKRRLGEGIEVDLENHRWFGITLTKVKLGSRSSQVHGHGMNNLKIIVLRTKWARIDIRRFGNFDLKILGHKDFLILASKLWVVSRRTRGTITKVASKWSKIMKVLILSNGQRKI